MSGESRNIEIDLLRVLAIILMMMYHTAYDLGVLYGWNVDVFHGAWWWVGKTSAVLFLLLVGISFQISWTRTPQASRSQKRGLLVLGYGFIVMIATYVFDPLTYVRFGILHLIGVSMVLMPLVRRIGRMTAVVGALLIACATYVQHMTVSTSFLIPVGILPAGFISVDYYPLVPWFGFVLLGMAIGNIFVRVGSPTFFRTQPRYGHALTAVSKKSLLIYMIHQPLVLLVLFLTLGRP